jgi:hypothetical protein
MMISNALEALAWVTIVSAFFALACAGYALYCKACDLHAWWVQRRERLHIERVLGRCAVPACLRPPTSHR